MPRAARTQLTSESGSDGRWFVAGGQISDPRSPVRFPILLASVDKRWEDLHGEHEDECCDGEHRKGFKDQRAVEHVDHELSPNGKCFPQSVTSPSATQRVLKTRAGA
jgi:hypothetical protein